MDSNILESTTHGNRQADPQEPLPRQCLIILETQYDPDHGYIPSLVIENESGHYPMTGRGPLAEPWYFGKTIQEARATCANYNQRAYGLTDDDCIAITCSSMFAKLDEVTS